MRLRADRTNQVLFFFILSFNETSSNIDRLYVRHLVDHVGQLLLLTLLLKRLEVYDCISWGTELNENYRCFFNSDVPIILQLVDQAPDRKANELRVSLQEHQILIDLDLRKVIAQATEATKNVETASFGL